VVRKRGLALKRIGLLALAAAVILALVVACGDDEEGPEPTETPSLTPASVTPTGTEAPTRTVVPDTPVGTVEANVPAGKIVFISRRTGDYEIFILTPEGEERLTNDPAEDENPDLSPDGDKIIFASNREGVYHIYIMDTDGSGVTKLTDADAGDLSPRWSPDGEQIAFSRTGAIYVMNSDGSNIRQITQPESEATAPPCKAGGFLGDWSPDGTQVTFYAASATRGLGQVCTVNVDGSDLTVVASEPEGWHVEPTWSADGEWIAYRFIGPDDNHEIYKVRPDGTDSTNLTENEAMDIEPGWSFDGEWIVFSSSRTGNFDLYMMRPDGSDVARLTNSSGKDSDPAWGP
jgi:TolB protein